MSVQDENSRSCSFLSSLGYNGGLVIWTVVCLTANKFKALWEQLIAYFPYIRHVPHRKRRLQSFVATGTCLPSHCLATTGDTHTDPQTLLRYKDRMENDTSNNYFTVACIRCHGNVPTEPLPSNDIRGFAYRDTHWWEGFMKDAVEMSSGTIIYIIPSFINIGSGIQGHTDRMEIA
jgi:hypothetical protein